MNFKNWLNTFVNEKGIDRETILEANGTSGVNMIPVGCLMAAMMSATASEQAGIKSMIVRIDFADGNVMDYFKHLAQALAI